MSTVRRVGLPGPLPVIALLTVAVSVACGSPEQAHAQEDFRHLDEGRPLRVEDAYAIKFREWEWEFGLRAAGVEGGAATGGGTFELKTGLFRNAQLGFEVHGEAARLDGTTNSGVEEIAFHFLYNINREGRRMPAVGLRADLALPGTGDLAIERPELRAKWMATRSFGSTRMHVNGARRWTLESTEPHEWEAGVALDHTLGLSSRLLAGDVFVQIPDEGRAVVWVDVGARLQLTRQSVLDVGVFSRVDTWDADVPNLGLTLGISRGFGVRSLTPIPPYPRPRLR